VEQCVPEDVPARPCDEKESGQPRIRLARPNGETHHNREKGSVIERKGTIVEGAAEYMRYPGWNAASVFLDDVERKGGGHDPDQASKRLSPKHVRVHTVSASPGGYAASSKIAYL
jgi:hypothetical protein